MSRLSLRPLFPRFSPPSFSSTLPTRWAGPAGTAVTSPLTFARGMARKPGKKKQKGETKVRMINYFLHHPAAATPRPLKFGTMRHLRHWTIHRAWQLFKRQERIERERELERQYNKIRDACVELEKTDERLYRIATNYKDLGTFPIEIRIPTDTPAKKPWNHEWKKA